MKTESRILSLFLLLPLLASCTLFERGTHNAGKNCMWPGCHGYDAPAWTYAGTVFTSVDRSTPAKGLAVIITDSTGEIRLRTNSAGNFFTSKGNPSGAYRVRMSDGTEDWDMRVEPTDGACNSCHAPDGETSPLHIE